MTDRIVAELLEAEGWPAFTDDPRDKGGATKGGITLATLSEWLGRAATVAELRDLPQATAEAIYSKRFITGPGFDGIADELLRWQVVDCGVLSGPRRAVEWLQFAADVKVDGQLGPKTLAAVNGGKAHRIGLRLACSRARFMARVVERDHDQAKWVAGWIARALRFVELEAGRG